MFHGNVSLWRCVFFTACLVLEGVFGEFFWCSKAQATLKVQEFTTPGGIPVRLQENRQTPVIALCFSLGCGSLQDEKGLGGTANFLASMLTEGTRSHSAEAFSALLQDLSISIGYRTTDDYFEGTLVTLRDNKEKAFDLMRESLFYPALDASGIQRVRDQWLSVLATKAHDPGYQVSLVLNNQIYGSHPRGRPNLGTPESIKKIQAKDLKAFMKKFSAQGLKVAVAGHISREEVERAVDGLFKELPKKSPQNPHPNVFINLKKGTKINKQKIPQTTMGFVQEGLTYQDERILKLVLLNRILTERLRLIVREQEGLAYSVGTYPTSNAEVGLLYGTCGTKNESAYKAQEQILSIFQSLKDHAIAEQEFEDAKAYVMGSYVLNFQSTPGIAQNLLGLMQIERPADYIHKRNALVKALTKQDIETFAKSFLKPEALFFVFYGDPTSQNTTPSNKKSS